MDTHAPSSQSEPLGIGERLRNAREARGLTLTAAETLTRIRAVYLQALEEERFDRLPGRMYIRGFLRTYAKVLGLNPDELTHAYPQAFTAPEQPILSSLPAEIPIRPVAPPSRTRRILLYVGTGLLLAIATLGLIGYQQLRQFSETDGVAPQPGSRVLVPGAEPVRPAPVPDQPAALPGQPDLPPGEVGVELVVRAVGTSWLRVLADNALLFQGSVHNGEVKTFRARRYLTVRVGNTEVVALYVNGQAVLPDPRRRVWEETFTAP